MLIHSLSGVLAEVAGKCVDGAKVVDICAFGDERLGDETSKIYRKDKELKKGSFHYLFYC